MAKATATITGTVTNRLVRSQHISQLRQVAGRRDLPGTSLEFSMRRSNRQLAISSPTQSPLLSQMAWVKTSRPLVELLVGNPLMSMETR
jgi:hypothetical protein